MDPWVRKTGIANMDDCCLKCIESFGKLDIKPGDTIVFKTRQRVSMVARKGIQIYVNRIFTNVKLLILDEGMDVGVISQEKS